MCGVTMHKIERTIAQQTQRTHLNQAQQGGTGTLFYMQRAQPLDNGSAYTMGRLAARSAEHYMAAGGVWPVPPEVQV